MLIKREKKTNMWLYIGACIFTAYFALRVATLMEDAGGFELQQINDVFASIWKINEPLIINSNTLKITGFVLLILLIFLESQRMKLHRNLEKNTYGSAEWGSANDTKQLRDPEFTKNQIFTETEIISQDMHVSGHNRNVILLGRPNTGKSRYYFKPNILNANGSIAVTDPKGELLRDSGSALLAKGYTIKVMNLRQKWESNSYNPFHYIKKLPKEAYTLQDIASTTQVSDLLAEDDVLTLVNTIMVNTKSETIQTPTGDPFWESATCS